MKIIWLKFINHNQYLTLLKLIIIFMKIRKRRKYLIMLLGCMFSRGWDVAWAFIYKISILIYTLHQFIYFALVAYNMY